MYCCMTCTNMQFSYSQHWTGTSLQLRLMWGVFSNVIDFNPLQGCYSPVRRTPIWPIDFVERKLELQ